MAVLTIHQYLDAVNAFITNVSKSHKSYYLYFGKPTPWTAANGNIDDTNVLVANASVSQHEAVIYNDISFGLKISNNNIAQMVPRYNWANNTYYDRYDQTDGNLYNKQFFVVTDNYEVYKVIDNNNGANSTIKPSLTTPYGTFSTADGYVWKYMYTVETNANTNFTSNTYIPVTPNANVSGNSIGGTIDVIRITNGGSNYQTYYSGYLTSSVNNYTVSIDNNASPFNDYYTGSSIYLNSGYGSGQIRKISKYDGLNKLVTVDTPFQTYAVFNLSNVTGAFNIGNILTQNLDSIAYLYGQGSFNVGDTIQQSDTNANGTIVTANSTVFKVTRNSGSNTFSLNTPFYNTTQSGTLQSGTANVTAGANIVYIASANTYYSPGQFIRIGSDVNNNIRRITATNTTSVNVATNFLNSFTSNVHYLMPYAGDVASITITSANGYISNTNLNGINLTYNNSATLGLNFIIGEKVDQVDINNINQGANGVISFANSTTLILTFVNGTWVGGTGLFVRGESSLQKANITSNITYPNITTTAPVGTFTIGQTVTARDSSSYASLGTANVVSYYTIPNQLTQYIISPTVTINGDGSNATAYAIVNNSINTTNNIQQIVVLNPGKSYSNATVTISGNSTFGSGATASPTISPATGHGSNTYAELGAKYVGISVNFGNGSAEGYKFPVYGKYRKTGIISDPLFADVTVNLTNFDRVTMQLTGVSGTFLKNESIVQFNSSNTSTTATGMVLSYTANNSNTQNGTLVLYNAQGTFAANSKYANGASANDNVVGLISNTAANVAVSNIIYFTTGNAEIVTEQLSLATAQINAVNSNTQIALSNVEGTFTTNDSIYDSVTGAHANVVSIYGSNNTIDITSVFGQMFNQTLRFPMTSNTGAFQLYETVTQIAPVYATGTVISTNNDVDIKYTGANGSFSVGNIISSQNASSNGSAIVSFANNTYLRLTALNKKFSVGDTIINNLNTGATVSNVFPVIVLNNVAGPNRFQSGPLTQNVVGSNSGSIGTNFVNNNIIYPDLVRLSGDVIYLENFAPFTLSNTSNEAVRLIIQF
jgi:hypothetical protein